MADYNVLKAAIADYVKDRTGLSTIDGDGLQETLMAMVNSLGANYQFAGVAKLTPTQTDPGTPDQIVFYIAAEPGTYTNFPISGGYLQVAENEVAIFKYNGQWSKETTGAATAASVSQLGQELTEKTHIEELQGVTKIVVSPLLLKKGDYYKVSISADGDVTIPVDGFSLQLRNLDDNTNLAQIEVGQSETWDGEEKSFIYKADKDYNNAAIRQYSVGLTTSANATYRIENVTAQVLDGGIPIISQSVEVSGIQRTRITKGSVNTDILTGYQFLGELSPTTNPGTPPNRSYSFASVSGKYTYCDNIVINEGESAVLIYENNAWRKQKIGVASLEAIESCKSLPSQIKNVIADIYVIGNTNDVVVSYVSFKVSAYGNDSIGMNVKYVDANGDIISGTEDALFIENVSNLSAGQVVKMRNFSKNTSGKATNNTHYYIRLSESLDWSSISQMQSNTSIVITKVGEGNNVTPFIADIVAKYNLEHGLFDIVSTPTTTALYYYNLFSEIFVKGGNQNYNIEVTYLAFNHSAFGGSNTLGFQLGYKIGSKVCALSSFSIDAHSWGADELHEITNYYSSPMEANGIRLFVRTSKEFVFPSNEVLINGYLLSIPIGRVDMKPDAFALVEVGTGKDFTTLRGALEFVNGKSNKNNHFKIILSPGTYELSDEYTEAEMKVLNFRGFNIPDYVCLEGDTKSGDVIISGTLTDALAEYDRGNGQLVGVYMSVLNPANTSWYENLIVTAYNIKYPIHDDWTTTATERTIKNCKFSHLGGTGINHSICHGYGGGTRANCHYYYEGCLFESLVGYGYMMHSNKNWNRKSSLYFKNCVFSSFNPNKKDVIIGSLGNSLSIKSPVFFENCSFEKTGIAVVDSETGDIGWDWEVSGVGNTLAPIYANSAETSEEHYVAMIDETVEMVADSAITQFAPVTFVNNCKVKAMTNEALNTFKGVALTSASDGDKVIIKFRGYLHYSELGLSSISYGNKVKVNSDGTFGLTTGDDWIGYCDKANFIRLRENFV